MLLALRPVPPLKSIPASGLLDNALELPAHYPGDAKERDQHHEAEARRCFAHDLLRDLAEGIANRDSRARPQARRGEIERQEGGPGQLRYPVGKAGDAANAVRVTMEQDHPDVVTVGAETETMKIEDRDVHQTLEYRADTAIIKGLPLALDLCLLGLLGFALDDDPPVKIVFAGRVLAAQAERMSRSEASQ